MLNETEFGNKQVHFVNITFIHAAIIRIRIKKKNAAIIHPR